MRTNRTQAVDCLGGSRCGVNRDRNRSTSLLRRQALELAHARLDALVHVRHPLVPVVEHAPKHVGSLPTDRDRRVRLLHRLRPEPYRIEVDMLPVELGDLLRPDRLHRKHMLAQHLPAPRRVDAMVAHLRLVPPGADPERHSTARNDIEGGDCLRHDDRVMLRDKRDARPEPEAIGDGRDGRQRDEGVDHALACLEPGGVVGNEGPHRQRDVRVLGQVERLEAMMLERPADLSQIRCLGGCSHLNAKAHDSRSCRHRQPDGSKRQHPMRSSTRQPAKAARATPTAGRRGPGLRPIDPSVNLGQGMYGTRRGGWYDGNRTSM